MRIRFPIKSKKAVENLYYISETDAEIFPFAGKRADAVSIETFISQMQNIDKKDVREMSAMDFFSPLTTIQDWYEDEEKQSAHKFSQLKELLEKNLRDLKVYKVGQIEIDVYVVGLNEENVLTGIKTKAVET